MRIRFVCITASLAISLLAFPSIVQARPSDPECAALAARFIQPGGGNAFRTLPPLIPSNSTLELDLVARSETVMIGDYEVAGVPVFEITPRASVRDIGMHDPTYNRFTLPDRCLSDPAWIYGGTRWQLRQRNTIDAQLRSELTMANSAMGETGLSAPEGGQNGSVPCDDTSLHTHGLLVQPRTPTPTDDSYGDYVFVTAGANPGAPPVNGCAANGPAMGHERQSSVHYRITIPRAPNPGENPLKSGVHPSGLFWYHPHPHGYSRAQLHGATSGLITVGSLTDYARLVGNRKLQFNYRYMLLKDAPIVRSGQEWRFDPTGKMDGAACGAVTDPAKAAHPLEGECQIDVDHRWIFTINGQRFPQIDDIRPGEVDILRMANASPNVTYNLSFEFLPQGSTVAEQLPFQIIALDGVSLNPGQAARPQTNLILMPAARAEIFLQPQTRAGRVVMKNALVDTNGDKWPAVNLASLRMPASPAVQPLTTKPRSMGKNAMMSTALVRGPFDACTPSSGTIERKILFVKRSRRDGAGPAPEVFGLIAAVKINGQWKVWDGSRFITIAEASTYLGKDADHPALPADDNFPAFGATPNYGAVCTRLGQRETWILENWTNEDHNFHIHQSKFQVIAESGSSQLRTARRSTEESDGMRELLGMSDALHDTIPVRWGGSDACDGSPTTTACTPRTVTIRIAFDRAEQVGKFVYHCHILEHEDLGMMAEIEVCPPNGPCPTTITQGAGHIH